MEHFERTLFEIRVYDRHSPLFSLLPLAVLSILEHSLPLNLNCNICSTIWTMETKCFTIFNTWSTSAPCLVEHVLVSNNTNTLSWVGYWLCVSVELRRLCVSGCMYVGMRDIQKTETKRRAHVLAKSNIFIIQNKAVILSFCRSDIFNAPINYFHCILGITVFYFMIVTVNKKYFLIRQPKSPVRDILQEKGSISIFTNKII